jgi:hypothetical protein
MGQTAAAIKRNLDGDEGFAFVCCRICGDHRRVINSQHLSKHDTDRAIPEHPSKWIVGDQVCLFMATNQSIFYN